MNAREWTKPELDTIWPVKGWTWGHVSGRVWALYCDAEPGQFVCMTVLGRLILPSHGGVPPTAALLAVIGQHEGRDSTEAMAEVLDGMADESAVGAAKCKRACWAAEKGFRTAVAMLRRGTVEEPR